jgi:hypothetical protein
MSWKVFFGHVNSVGVEVEAPSEKEARIAAMDVLRLNREETKWSSRQCVYWEEGKTTNKPPVSRFFGEFPAVVKVEELG